MKFLSWWWIPFWLYVGLTDQFIKSSHHSKDGAGLAVLVFLWLGVNILVTLVYIATRVFRRATSDGQRQR